MTKSADVLFRWGSWAQGDMLRQLVGCTTAEARQVTAQSCRQQMVETWHWNWRAGPGRSVDSGAGVCLNWGRASHCMECLDDRWQELGTETGLRGPTRWCAQGPRSYHSWGQVGLSTEVWATDNSDCVLKPEGKALQDPVIVDAWFTTVKARQVTAQSHQGWREGTCRCNWRAEL